MFPGDWRDVFDPECQSGLVNPPTVVTGGPQVNLLSNYKVLLGPLGVDWLGVDGFLLAHPFQILCLGSQYDGPEFRDERRVSPYWNWIERERFTREGFRLYYCHGLSVLCKRRINFEKGSWGFEVE